MLAPSEAHAQKLAAALPAALTHEGPILNASGSHVVVYSQQQLTPDDVDGVFDVYVYTVATGAWRRLPRSLLVGLWDAVDTATMQMVSLSDDGRYLALLTRRVFPFAPPAPWVLARYDIATGTRVVVRDAAHDRFNLPTMSRDGSTFAWLGDRNAVIVATVGQRPLTIGQACPAFSIGECQRRPLLTERGERVVYLVGPGGIDAQADRLEVFDRATNTCATYPEFRPGATDFATTATGSHVFGLETSGAGTVFDLARRIGDPMPVGVGFSPMISDDARYVLLAEGKVYDRHSSSALASGADYSRGLSADGRTIAVVLDGMYALLDLDGDNDGMRDPWETVYGLNPASAIDGDLDADGDGVANREEFARGSHPRGLFRRYFAEGVSSDFFETTVYAFAPGTWMTPRPRPITVTFTTEDGRSASRTLRRFQSDSTGQATAPPILGTGVYSILVESEEPLAAERMTTWGGVSVRGAHASSGVAAPSASWVFAEGTTRAGIQLFYLLSNPGDTAANVLIRHVCADLFPGPRWHAIPARSRLTVWVNQEGAPLGGSECGAILASDQLIVAERSMYMLGSGQFSAGTSSTGMAASEVLPETWYLPAGATVDPFDMFLTLVNPVPTQGCDAEVTYMLPDGPPITRIHGVRGAQRLTIWVDHEDPRLAQAGAVATRVRCLTGPIFVERAMWWRAPGAAAWIEGHVERGSLEATTRWALAHVPESATLAILNTDNATGQAKITMYAKNGVGAAERVIPIPPGLTSVRPTDLWPALGPDRYSATVESLTVGGSAAVRIVVERTSYAPGMTTGTAFLGTPIP